MHLLGASIKGETTRDHLNDYNFILLLYLTNSRLRRVDIYFDHDNKLYDALPDFFAQS